MAKKHKSRRRRNQLDSSDSEPPETTIHPAPVSAEEILKPLLDPKDLALLIAKQPDLALKISQIVIKQHSGPLPSPETVEGYESVYPGAAKIVFDQFEKQAGHARDIEAKVVEAKVGHLKSGRVIETRGQYLAFFIVLVALGIGAYVTLELGGVSGAISGAIFGVSGLGSIVTIFIVGRKSERGAKKDGDEGE